MKTASFNHGKPRFARLRRQQGQALVYGVFVLLGGLAALFFLFNTGQLTQEKTKLVNTADAVAYSAGVMHARALNFHAYTNRAMVANTVAIAQLVSLASWVHYVNNTSQYAFSAGNSNKYPAFAPAYELIRSEGRQLERELIDDERLEELSDASDQIIQQILMHAQRLAHMNLPMATQNLMQEVADANYRDDGTVRVQPMFTSITAYNDFVSLYEGDDRTRFAEVAETSAKRDRFLRRRSWMLPATYSNCGSAMAQGRLDWLSRRGGTELIDFDEWKAMDTLSEKVWVPRNQFDALCTALSERPQGWGAHDAAERPSMDTDFSHYDYSVPVNPGSSAAAIFSSEDWDYSGLPSFYDLSDDVLGDADPRLKFAVQLTRSIGQTLTSEGRSSVQSTPRLNAYRASPASGNDIVAVAASEVFFERPDQGGASCSDGSRIGRDNCYGRTAVGRSREIGSLFNPYWQVRLVHDSDAIDQARIMGQLP